MQSAAIAQIQEILDRPLRVFRGDITPSPCDNWGFSYGELLELATLTKCAKKEIEFLNAVIEQLNLDNIRER